MIPARLSITQARRLLPSLVHDLERHPERVFQISVRRRLVAELKAPAQVSKRGVAAERLLFLAKNRSAKGQPASWRVSEDTDLHIY
jgi:hypothetical protein